MVLYLILGGIALALIGGYGWRALRTHLALRAPFPDEYLNVLKRRLPMFEAMPQALQEQLLLRVKRFLLRKRFVGCAGMEVTDEMKVSVAACACLLLLNRTTTEFKDVRWIYLYPAEFKVRHSSADEAGVVSEMDGILAGEAWGNGRVVLSWSDVEDGIHDFRDGHNVVLHEFAHQLDGESGSMNGAPLLQSRGAYGSWAAVLEREYKELREHAYLSKQSVLDAYGATNPAEFFAVATESFFEQPEALAGKHPELYAQLRDYYQVDPREWLAGRDRSSP